MMIDISDKIDEIRKKYRPHKSIAQENAECHEVAALWGFTPDMANYSNRWVDYNMSVSGPVEIREKLNTIRLCTASSPSGLWAYGIDAHTSVQGLGFSPFIYNRKQYTTKKEAVQAALADVLAYDWIPDKYKAMIKKAVDEAFPTEQYQQLSLFD
jgi:hypothetical protein